MPKLDIQHIRAGYGDLKVLFDVSLHVDEGEIVSLVGSNGPAKQRCCASYRDLNP